MTSLGKVALGLGAGSLAALAGYRATKVIRKEKKNPKFAFSRTRKAYHRSRMRSHADFERQFRAAGPSHLRINPGGYSGWDNPTWGQLANEFKKKKHKHAKKLKRLEK